MGLLRSPDGAIVTIPDEQGIPAGYTPVTPAEAGAQVESDATGGLLGAAGAGATGILSGATLGLSDLALKGILNRGDFRRLAADRDDHPVVSGTGQFVGALAPAILSGGGATPAGFLSRATAGISEGGGLGGAVLATGLEGAVQNAGVYLSDTALGDRDLTAQGMLGALGTGFAFGNAGAVAAHGIQAGTIAARRMFARLAEGGDQAAKVAAQEWATKSQAVLEAYDQTADAARAQLAAARAAREQAELARQQAGAGLAEARAAAPAVDAARAPLVDIDNNIAKIEAQEAAARAAVPPATGGLEDLQKLADHLDEYTAARHAFDDMRARVDHDLQGALQGLGEIELQAPAVPIGEFGAPGAHGIKSPDELARAAAEVGQAPAIPTADATLGARPGPLAEGTPGRAPSPPVEERIPEYDAIRAHEDRVDDYLERSVPARDIAERGYYEMPGSGEHALRMEDARKAIAEGQRSPIRLSVSREGKIIVTDGRHRLAAAIEADAPISVKWSTGGDPASGDVFRGGQSVAPAADPSLAGRLRGTLKSFAAGESLPQPETLPPAIPVRDMIPGTDGVIPALKSASTEAKDFIITRAREVGQRFGDRKVFLGSLGIDWSIPQHRETLFALMKRGELQLARADLVAAMDPAMVKASHVPHPGGEDFHFVVDEHPPVSAAPLANTQAGRESDLEAMLRGTKGAIDKGGDIRAIGRAPAAATRAEQQARAASAAEHFRAQALAARAERAGLGDPSAPWNVGATGAGGGYEGSAMAASEAAARQEALAQRAGVGGRGHKYAVQREHPMAVKQLELAHDDALERAAAATDPAERRAAVAEAKSIETQIGKIGARPGAVEDVAAMAAVTTRVEKAAAALTEAVGDAAPATAKEAAAAYRAAEDDASRKTVARIARAADDGAAAQVPGSAGVDRRPGPTGAARVAAARQAKLEADVVFARARAAETEASIGAKDASSAADDARAAVRAGAPVHAVGTPSRIAGIGAKVIAGAQAVEIAHDVGIPGIPSPHDIPVIGPLLSTYLKYRTLRAAAGRFMGRVPATAETKAAALAARTKDKIAAAVDRSLGIVERNTPTVRAAVVASGIRVNDALSRRAFDDGQPDAPAGASPQALAAVRMREVAAAAMNPQLVVDKVRKETRAITDPDLIDALEKHLVAMYQHLNDTAPKGPPPNPYTRKEWQPSAAEALQWGSRLAVANDPTVAFDALHAQSLTPVMADTMRAVYDRLFALAQQRVIERAADLKHPVPYRQLAQNAMLFDVPLHASLVPENAAVLATAHAPAPAAPGNPSPSIANATDVSKLYQTTSDRRSAQR